MRYVARGNRVKLTEMFTLKVGCLPEVELTYPEDLRDIEALEDLAIGAPALDIYNIPPLEKVNATEDCTGDWDE